MTPVFRFREERGGGSGRQSGCGSRTEDGFKSGRETRSGCGLRIRIEPGWVVSRPTPGESGLEKTWALCWTRKKIKEKIL